jgi:hypothetical protein
MPNMAAFRGTYHFKESLPFHEVKESYMTIYGLAARAAEIFGAVVKLMGRF